MRLTTTHEPAHREWSVTRIHSGGERDTFYDGNVYRSQSLAVDAAKRYRRSNARRRPAYRFMVEHRDVPARDVQGFTISLGGF